MSIKTTLLSIFAILVIGGAIYSVPSKKIKEDAKYSPTFAQVSHTTPPQETTLKATSTEPTRDATPDQIINYLIDDITSSEISETEKIIEGSTYSPTEITLSTNF